MNKENLEKLINEVNNKSSKKAPLMELSDDDLDNVTGGVEWFDQSDVPISEYEAKVGKVYRVNGKLYLVVRANLLPNKNTGKATIFLEVFCLEGEGETFFWSDEFKDAVEIDINTLL